MAMNEDALKKALKDDLITLFADCKEGEGMAEEDYADNLAGIIAKRVIEHITKNAAITPGPDWLAGGYKVTGGATGKVS
jgi:hypothetical protein